MRIANNVMAMNTHRQYTINNNNVAKSAEKLSSGYRINRAGDDAAGLAISEKMRAQIRGLNMAGKNSQDGNSLIQTAEGALQEVHSILQRMNELSVQSATGTNQTLDRNALNAEFQQLASEIDDISVQTTFNDTNILDGTFKVRYSNGAFDTAAAALGQVVQNNVKVGGNYFVKQTAAGVSGGFKGVSGSEMELQIRDVDDPTKILSTSKINIDDILQGVKLTSNDGTKQLLKTGESVFIDLTTFGLGSYEFTVTAGTGNEIAGAINGILGAIIDTTADSSGTGVDFKLLPANDNPLKIQVGAKEAEQMEVGIDDVTAAKLGLSGRAIDNQTAAGRAISVTRSAINQVSSIRGALGAAQNRLDHKIANLNNSVENLAAAESRIRDVDMASEMTQFTKANVLSQASTAMLAQANSLPQNVLSLLR